MCIILVLVCVEFFNEYVFFDVSCGTIQLVTKTHLNERYDKGSFDLAK